MANTVTISSAEELSRYKTTIGAVVLLETGFGHQHFTQLRKQGKHGVGVLAVFDSSFDGNGNHLVHYANPP